VSKHAERTTARAAAIIGSGEELPAYRAGAGSVLAADAGPCEIVSSYESTWGLKKLVGKLPHRQFSPLPKRVRYGRGGLTKVYHDKLVALIYAEEAKLIDHLGGIVHGRERRICLLNAKHQWQTCAMNQKCRELILYKPERAIADENGCTVDDLHAVIDRHQISVYRDQYLKRVLALQLL
jgi:hypothetical protein